MHEAVGSDAASVASRLVAFYRDPVRHRPRLTHGHETFAGGHHVLRFAQGKFPHGIVRDLTRAQRDEVRAAARAFIRQVCFWEDATHYQVLCVPPGARREVVKENYHLLMALIHPDRAEHEASGVSGDERDPWPQGCAQRVNRAYEVLSAATLRHEYDAGLDKAVPSNHTVEFAGAGAGAAAARAGRHRIGSAGVVKPVFVVTGVIASLFFLQLWWVSDVPGEHSILERAFPIQASAQWMRDALSAAQPPKFLTMMTGATRDDRTAAAPADEPSRDASRAAPVSKFDRDPVAAPRETAQAAATTPELPPQLAQAPARPEPAPRGDPPAPAQAPAPAATPAVAVTPGTPAPAPRIRSEDIEILVARLVNFYEAGDLERVMALLDAREAGVWRTLQARNMFADFFRATSRRRLRLNNLSWQIVSGEARVKGDATLQLEHFDGSGPTERRIEVEMDLAVRDGQLRIARLVLFPNVP